MSKPPDYFKNKFLLLQQNMSINIGLYLLLCFDNGCFHIIYALKQNNISGIIYLYSSSD